MMLHDPKDHVTTTVADDLLSVRADYVHTGYGFFSTASAQFMDAAARRVDSRYRLVSASVTGSGGVQNVGAYFRFYKIK